MKIIHNKLVRDNIIDIIESQNKKASYHILNDQDYVYYLKKKLIEESIEVDSSISKDDMMREMADVLEVLEALMNVCDIIINDVLSFELENIAKYKKAIKRSISKTTKLRQELENSNISEVKSYMQQRAKLFEQKSYLYDLQLSLEQQLTSKREIFSAAESELSKAKAELEIELKKASINNISAKAIVMLDELQKILYRKKIKEDENFFKKEIKTLMRKTNFIEDISIDESFNIHIYRNEVFDSAKIVDLLTTNSE